MITYINMKKIIFYFTAIIFAISFTSCRDCEYEVEYSAAALWKNGVKQELPYGDSPDGLDIRTYSVFVSGNDVYVAGCERYDGVGVLWKNGIAQVLPFIRSSSLSVLVSENDVYVVGNNMVWKNGEVVYTLNDGLYSISVYDGDVYVAGDKHVWKNGEVIQTLGSEANSIVVYNGDVYVATEYTVYKNGEVIQSSPSNARFSSLFVSDEDVYVSGFEVVPFGSNKARLWKNGIEQNLGGVSGEATSVFVSGNDVYVTTVYSVLKNGVVIMESDLRPNATESSYFTSVFVSGNDVYVAGFYYKCIRVCS
jgi:hypothetical protein